MAHPLGDRFDDALTYAARLHRTQTRKSSGVPYVSHLLAVCSLVIEDGGDEDEAIAALLHDAVEDHPEELAGTAGGQSFEVATAAAVAELARLFNPRVAELVRAVTNPEFDPALDRNEQYVSHVAQSLDRHPWARVIKVSDFTDNGVGVIHTTGRKAHSSAAKYRPLVPTFREMIGRADTPLSATAKSHILDQLDLAEERFAAILDG
jgi:(p)ppGpp synthase/HD superfamily hydrolase